ncbi:hypothetical protein SDC9_110340 [bioreactor metagenome]|uniref:Carbohydrate-binding domain-containing protein n=1 Tax=bioreactor metagenome TaxID=1076179 RepID=A0A645BDB8_9ZZZZ
MLLFDRAGGKLAETQFNQRPGRPGLERLLIQPEQPLAHSSKELQVALPKRGVKISAQAELHNRNSGNVSFTPEQAALEIRMLPMYASNWNDVAGALEMTAKRYLQIRLSGNFAWMGSEGPFSGARNFTQHYGDAGTMAALVLDFKGSQGYTVRSFAGLGVLNPPIETDSPSYWGTAKPAEHLFTISSFVGGQEGKNEEVIWLDLATLGAPADWTGKLWFGVRFCNANANRQLKVEVLQSTDTLPTGVQTVEPYVLKGGVKHPAKPLDVTIPQAATPVRIDGKLNETAWNNALVFNDFLLLGNPVEKAPPTTVKMMRDDRNIYIGVVFEETRAQGFRGSREVSCWYNDGIEMYFQKRTDPQAFCQFIVDVSDGWFGSEYSSKVSGAPAKKLARPDFATVREAKRWTMEIALPITLLGNGNAVTGFNFGRNRTRDGGMQTFSLASGMEYQNFEKNRIRW